jgi:hypothetical protein
MSDDLSKLKDAMSALAERIAKEGFGITLDYSNDSVDQVEKVLGLCHKDYKKTRSEDGLRGIAFEFGAYIVKVIEKNVGPVRWERNHPQMGEDAFPLYLGEDDAIFPVAWCLKRIYDGPGDDVWIKYNQFVLKRDPPSKGFLSRMFRK